MTDQKQFCRDLRCCMRGYKHMNRSLKRQLQTMGFQIEQGGSHYKIWHPEIKGVYSLAATASDHREGLNFAACVCRNIE